MLKLAIVGFGVFGRNHFRILDALDSCTIVSVCDIQLPQIDGVRVYSCLDTMLSNEVLDAVIICSPTSTHLNIACKCLAAGLDIFIEKPAASTSSDANAILLEREKFNAKVVVGHVERFNPAVIALKEALMDQEILSISITRVGPFPPRIADVGILVDLSVHDIDILRFITGKEIVSSGIYKSKKIHRSHEDNAILSFTLQDEIVASITTNWLTPFKKRSIEVSCRSGYFVADLLAQELTQYSKYDYDTNSFTTRNCSVDKVEPLKSELINFLSFIKGDEDCFCASLEDSIKTLEIIGY